MVDWGRILSSLSCPNKRLQQCLTDLGASNEQLGKAQEAITNLTGQLKDANVALAVLTANLQDCNIDLGAAQQALAPLIKERDDLLALSKLLTEGPPSPDVSKMRWVSQGQIEALMSIQLGAKYVGCPTKLWSESDYLVCPLDEMKRFIAYYAMFWLPHLKYTTQMWKKLDGSEVEVWKMDCDDFADFFQGIAALNADWASFPWATIWAEVQGLFIAGGHAFNAFVACDNTYIENGVDGLKAYLLEPQLAGGGPWPAGKSSIEDYVVRELKEVSGAFEIKGTIWMAKF